MKSKKMPEELRKMLGAVCSFSSCGGIRSYYDVEAVEKFHHYEYEYENSQLIHNFFALLEVLTNILLSGDVEEAESFIREYYGDLLEREKK
jgi:hypothetical protein